MESHTPTADHDLLIEVNTNVKNLSATLQQYTSSTSRDMQDHESRLRTLEAESTQKWSELKGAQDAQKKNMNIIATVGGVIAIAITVIQFVMG